MSFCSSSHRVHRSSYSPKRRRSGAKPCTAQRNGGGATPDSTFCSGALFHNALTHFTSLAWWIGVNLILGILGPLLVGQAWVYFNSTQPKVTLRQFYQHGELGLVSLTLALTVILDVRKASYSGSMVGTIIGSLAVFSFIAGVVWVIPLCNDLVGVKVDWDKVVKVSKIVAWIVLCVGVVTEILLEWGS